MHENAGAAAREGAAESRQPGSCRSAQVTTGPESAESPVDTDYRGSVASTAIPHRRW